MNHYIDNPKLSPNFIRNRFGSVIALVGFEPLQTIINPVNASKQSVIQGGGKGMDGLIVVT